jgi:hypothetical protein
MEAESTSAATEYMEFPTDYLELRDIQFQSNPRRQLRYVTPEYADLYDSSGTTGPPLYYTVVGNQIRLVPSPDTSTTVRISYWQKITPLSGSATSNWLLEAHPDAYLYGPLFHGLVWANNPQMAGFIKEGWAQVMNEMQGKGKQSNIGGSLQIRPA